MTSPQRILVVGDLHSNTGAALEVVDHAAAVGAELIVQCGDFGFWGGPSGDSFLRKVARRLERHGLTLLWLSGNHENHSKLNAQPVQADGTHWLQTSVGWSPVIRHMPHGYRWQWGDTTWLAVGGAVSVDKASRTPGRDWFPEEELTEAEADAIIAAGPAEVVVSHDAPLGVPFLRHLLGQDKPAWRRESPWPTGVVMASDEHQRRIRRVVEGVMAGRVFAGHHHRRYSNLLQAACGPVVVEGLGMDLDPLAARCLLVDSTGRPIVSQGSPGSGV